MHDWQALTTISRARSRRSSSYDRTGGNDDYVQVAAGSTCTLQECSGAGVIRHIWITLHSHDPMYRKNLVLRMTWDGHPHASVECPVGDFFGNGWGETYNFSSPYLACAPRDGRALVCYFPMPFALGAKIELVNESPEFPLERLYFYVDWEELDGLPPDTAYFHAQYRQELTQPENAERDENEWALLRPYGKNPGTQNNFVVLETSGTGHFVGVNYYVNNPGPMWYGEGDDMILVDGEPWPGLHGTGTEDYFNTSWSPDERYDHPCFGIARVPGFGNAEPRIGWLGRTHLYRFHHMDPIRYQNSLSFSIEHGHDNCLTLELATVAYYYQTLSAEPLLALPPLEARLPRPVPTASDIHRWRDAYLKSLGPGPHWGTGRQP